MKNSILIDFEEKFSKGLKLAFKRLVKEKAEKNQELVFYKDRKIVFVKAKELL